MGKCSLRYNMLHVSSYSKNTEKTEEAELDDTEKTEVVLPEVSQEKFYEMSDSLRDTFVSKATGETQQGGTFSLLAAFGKATDKQQDLPKDYEGFHNNQISIVTISLFVFQRKKMGVVFIIAIVVIYVQELPVKCDGMPR